jgi:dihydroorotate dehydrogenase electron transfer subunit
MRLHTATIITNTLIHPSVYLLDLYVPLLAQAVTPGQYCMIRCCHPQALDPLLRRPFFIQGVRRSQGRCTLLVHERGRGTKWLVQQPEGTELDMLGPLGHGWTLHSTTRNVLLVSEDTAIVALPFLAQVALEQECTVTLVSQVRSAEEVYPPVLLPQEVEYHIVTTDGSSGQQGDLATLLAPYVQWADAAYCSVSRETLLNLYTRFERLRGKNFAQGIALQPLVCGNGACFACTVEARSGQKLVCRDGPVFDLRELVW